MEFNFVTKLAPFGLKHEIAKRYTLLDWYRSAKVAKRIDYKFADDSITRLIEAGKPGLVGRLGGTEARYLGEIQKIKKKERVGIPIEFSLNISKKWKKRQREVFTNAGFYSNSFSEVEKFSEIYLEAMSITDVIGAWGVAFTWIESKFLNPERAFIPVGFTAPWVEPYSTNSEYGIPLPWSSSLEGKKILVVSPFAESISSQHKRINDIFPDLNYPKFELEAIKSPMTAGLRDANSKSWFQLLKETEQRISEADFDVALISAGAYSYPLAAYVKKIGRIGIHCGGGLQLFFGVMGNRWNNSPEIQKYVNQFWVRPSDAERPITASSIENACYW